MHGTAAQSVQDPALLAHVKAEILDEYGQEHNYLWCPSSGHLARLAA
jgi:hypothetical protein